MRWCSWLDNAAILCEVNDKAEGCASLTQSRKRARKVFDKRARMACSESMTATAQTFGQRLRAERKRLGLTKAELAEVLGEVSASWVDKAERGVTEPHQWMKDKAIEELGKWEEFKSTEVVEAPKPMVRLDDLIRLDEPQGPEDDLLP